MARRLKEEPASAELAPTDDSAATVSAANARADKIRGTLSFAWKELAPDIIAAYEKRDWETLGYADWASYMAGEFAASWPAFQSKDERQEIVFQLSELGAGMSQRAIAAATGISQATVSRILELAAAGGTAKALEGAETTVDASESPGDDDVAETSATGAEAPAPDFGVGDFTQPEGTFLTDDPEGGLYRAGKVEMSSAVRYVATKLGDGPLSFAELRRSYKHLIGGDLARIGKHEEGDPETWALRQAIRELGSQLIVDDNDVVRLAEGRRADNLIWRRPGSKDSVITLYQDEGPAFDPANPKPWQTDDVPPVDPPKPKTERRKTTTGTDGSTYQRPEKEKDDGKPATDRHSGKLDKAVDGLFAATKTLNGIYFQKTADVPKAEHKDVTRYNVPDGVLVRELRRLAIFLDAAGLLAEAEAKAAARGAGDDVADVGAAAAKVARLEEQLEEARYELERERRFDAYDATFHAINDLRGPPAGVNGETTTKDDAVGMARIGDALLTIVGVDMDAVWSNIYGDAAMVHDTPPRTEFTIAELEELRATAAITRRLAAARAEAEADA